MFGLDTITLPAAVLLAGLTGCPTPPTPHVSVVLNENPIRYNYKNSSEQLSQMQIDTVSPYGDAHITGVGGVFSGGVSIHSGYQMTTKGSTPDRVCTWITEVTVTITHDPVIYVASEYHGDRCRRKHILEHEHKHALLNRKILNLYREQIEKAVAKAGKSAKAVGPYVFDDLAGRAAGKKAFAHFAHAINAQTDLMSKNRRKLQQEIDSREEYDRLAAVCSDTY